MAWWLGADQRPAYDMHRAALGLLQSRAPGPWALKDPWHLLGLETLFEVYPDARVVVLHRDPRAVVPSLAGLSAATGSDAMRTMPVPPSYWGDQYLEALGVAADKHLAARRTLPAERFLDIAYRDLIADPMEVGAAIYAFAERPLTDAAATAIRQHVADRPKDKYGVHRYTLEQFGLTDARVAARFAGYLDTYRELID
jgi:hypothetical protein